MLPVTIIGGYLGAGKTTLINHVLRHAGGARLAVLVNEFGALPIDEDLIEAQDDTLISIAGGCVCCSYGNDLIQAMLDIGKLDPPPDHILIESSGVALPGAIAASVSLIDGVTTDGIVVLVDAETIRDKAADAYVGDTVMRQLAQANLVLINKSDLVSQGDLDALEAWLHETAMGAAVVQMSYGAVPNAVILQGFDPDPAGFKASGKAHVASFASKVLTLPDEVEAESMARLLAGPELGLVRAKGFVRTASGMRAIQIVGRRWQVSDAPADVTPGIVVIAESTKCDLSRVSDVVEAAAAGKPATYPV